MLSIKLYITIIFIVSSSIFSYGQINSEIQLDSLDYYLSKKDVFDKAKEKRINTYKNQVQSKQTDLKQLYSLYDTLYHEYCSYVYDSAYAYCEKLHKTAYALNDHDKITASLVKKGFSYMSAGLFKECFDLFSSIDLKGCSNQTKIDYYTTKARLYYDVADYNNKAEFSTQYNEIGNAIIDSAITLLPIELPQFWACTALKKMKSDNYRGAIEAFQKMILSHKYSEHDYAIATSSLAYLFNLQGKKDDARQLFIKAAIADIKSSTKETVALRNLAQILYEEGDIGNATKYIRQALDDAYFYNARHRQLEISHILPIIEKERTEIVEKQKSRIYNFTIFVSILLVILLIALFVIWKQLAILRQAKKVNQSTNDNLIEANKIKEEYIGYFFTLHSEFINNLKKYQKYVQKKAMEKKYDELTAIPRNMDPTKEREALYARFDQIFLKIFPDFVSRFNELLTPGEEIQLKEGKLLNTDLRIYALIRLGIDDNEKIAEFLDYSINTIYTYKTKTKNKTKLSNEAFKKKIMEIKSA